MLFIRNSTLVALTIVCLAITTNEISSISRSSKVLIAFNTRVYTVSKQRAGTSGEAILIAEKSNPGWKVQSIKELGVGWHMVMVKER